MILEDEVTLNSYQSILIYQIRLDHVSSVLWIPYDHLRRQSTDHTIAGRHSSEQVRSSAPESGHNEHADTVHLQLLLTIPIPRVDEAAVTSQVSKFMIP